MTARSLGIVTMLLWVALRVPFLSLRPDTPQARLEHLDRALHRARAVRVTTHQGRFVVADARADSAGLHWSRAADPGLMDSVSAPGAIAWPGVERVETRVSAWKKDAKLGAQWGGGSAFLVGLVAGLAGGLDIDSITIGILAGAGGSLVGAPVGAAIGAAREDWKPVYPPKEKKKWFGLSLFGQPVTPPPP